MASELVTAREVVSRTLKKLETEGKVRQRSGYIELI
ncbi:MAG: helix-turn-helix domain-containing protein [Bacteroidota bacterium]